MHSKKIVQQIRTFAAEASRRMTRLSVNVNKVATLRNARGGNLPDLAQVSRDILRFGAAGITVHPRPDERHIKENDLGLLYSIVQEAQTKDKEVEFNVEGYPDERFMRLLRAFRPHQATLVPDSPEVRTSDTGWDIKSNTRLLKEVLSQLKAHDIRTSLFVEAETTAVQAAKEVGADCIELYTGPYAQTFFDIYEDYTDSNALLVAEEGKYDKEEEQKSPAQEKKNLAQEKRSLAEEKIAQQDKPLQEHDKAEAYDKRLKDALRPYVEAAHCAQELGLRVNAGHDLNLYNISAFVRAIPSLEEVSVGHALICEALYYGLENVVGMYLERIKRSKSGY